MSLTQTITFVALLIYFSCLCFMNWRGRRQTAEGYAIGGRKVGYIATTGTIAAGIRDGSGVIVCTSFGFTNGYVFLWAFIGAFLSFCLMAAFGPKARALAIKRNYVTINQMIHDDIGVYTQKLATVLMMVIALLIMSMQVYVAGHFFSALLHQPEWMGMIGIACLVGFYLFLGGYSAVIRTNTFQFFWIISLLVIPFLIVPHKEDLTNYASFFSMSLWDRVAFFIIGFCYPLGGGDTWQHLFSARNDRVIRTAFPSGGIVLFLMTLSLIFLGFGIKTYLPGAEPQKALFDFFRAELVSPWILSYIAIVVMAVTTSDLDSQTYLFTSTSIKNIAPPSIARDEKRYRYWARCVIIGSLAFTTLVALSISDVVQFLFQTVSLFYILAPVFTFSALGFIRPSVLTDRLVFVTLIVASGVHLWLFGNHLMDKHLIFTVVPAIVSLAGCTLIAFWQKAKQAKHA